jgi:copper(I)-binding protein
MVAPFHQVRSHIMPGMRRSALGGLASRRLAARLAVVGSGLAMAAALLAGCGQQQPAGPMITLLSAQVTEPSADGLTDAYLIVQNKGPAVRLIGARTSAGGTIALRSPARHGVVLMRTVPAIVVPAHSLFRLDPNGSHLLITGSGPMTAGTEITLTLVFAHLGSFTVPAMVTNPQTGGSSYFLN